MGDADQTLMQGEGTAGHRVGEDRWVWVPFEVDKKFDGYRIDRFLSQRLAGYSRSKVQAILAEARVMKGERPAKANTKVRTGDKIQIAYRRRPEPALAPGAALPVLFEDDDLILVNKPADLLSHPTDKIVRNTVLGFLRHARPDLPTLHLLHRLDRETSGVLALAKTVKAARAWTRRMDAHEIRKEYIAIVRGEVAPAEGVIELPIGRQGGPIRVRQWVNVPGAVPALTRYAVTSVGMWGRGDVGMLPPDSPTSRLPNAAYSVVRAFPKTGRLHQIRVHFAALGHPLLGDPLYTGAGEVYQKMTQGTCTGADRIGLGFPRVALHAAALAFPHPISAAPCRVEAPLPDDMASFLGDCVKMADEP